MKSQRIRRTPKSLSYSQIALRVLIAGVVILLFLFVAIFLNHWYLYTHSQPPQKVAASSQQQPQPVPELPSTPRDVSPEPGKSSQLTFYDRLTQKEPRDSMSTHAPPVPGQPQPVPQEKASEMQTPTAIPPQPEQGGKESFGYTVQVGAFQSLDYAQEIVELLKQKGFSPSLTTVFLPDGKTWHRVRVGNFALREEAETMVQELKESGQFEPMIISPQKKKEESPQPINNSVDSAAAQSLPLSP